MKCDCKHSAAAFLIKFLQAVGIEFEECDSGLSFWIDGHLIILNKKTNGLEAIE